MQQRELNGPARECFVHRDTVESSSEEEEAEIQLISNAQQKNSHMQIRTYDVCIIVIYIIFVQ